jgi:hypothetical protein
MTLDQNVNNAKVPLSDANSTPDYILSGETVENYLTRKLGVAPVSIGVKKSAEIHDKIYEHMKNFRRQLHKEEALSLIYAGEIILNI